jgi:excisionase family DNA binding protein
VLNAQEVAERLGVAEKTVRRWIEAKKLPAEKRGRAFAIRLEDALAMKAHLPRRYGAERLRELHDSVSEREEELIALRTKCALLEEQLIETKRELMAAVERAAVAEAGLRRVAA